MLSAVNGAGLTIAVGCAISALCIGLVAAFGIAILHVYERSAPTQINSTALKLTVEQIRLGTASICSTHPYWLRWPQFQHLIAIYRSIRHNHSKSLLIFRTSVLCGHHFLHYRSRLLRLLPHQHKSTSHVLHDLGWHVDFFDLCKPYRCRDSDRRRHNPRLG